MTETLYPISYGTRMVTFEVLRQTFEPNMHPEAARRAFNFILLHGGKFGVGGGYRPLGSQPNKPGFAAEGRSFHQPQQFPSGLYYVAWDLVVANPGGRHRAPRWDEVPEQGGLLARELGYHMNVGKPGTRGSEPWHGQPIELDGWYPWSQAGKPDITYNYPIKRLAFNTDEKLSKPAPVIIHPVRPTAPTLPKQTTKEITVNVNSTYLKIGSKGSAVKFFQELLRDVGAQPIQVDGIYGPKTAKAVENWQIFFGLYKDGEAGPITQKSILEISITHA